MVIRVTAVCIVLALIEASALVVGQLISDDIYYRPPTKPEFTKAIESYETLGPEGKILGWLPKSEFLDKTQARLSPSGEKFKTHCLSLYGDSFTYGAEVDNDSVWGDLVAKALGCRVTNYGVVGYGTDQAMLRHQTRIDDKAPIVILTHMIENIVRNVNQDRTLIYGAGIQLKPRYIQTENGLVFIERPTPHPNDYIRFVKDPESVLANEYFIPESSALAKRRLQFPYTWHVPAIFAYQRVSRGVTNMFVGGPPWYAEFYDHAHPSGALSLTAAILETFKVNSEQREQRGVVFLVPTAREILYFLESGHWIQRPLYDALIASGIEVYDLGPRFVEALALEEPDPGRVCEFFCTKPRLRGGHYTAAGNVLLAETAVEIISQFEPISTRVSVED